MVRGLGKELTLTKETPLISTKGTLSFGPRPCWAPGFKFPKPQAEETAQHAHSTTFIPPNTGVHEPFDT